jgi:hypothetical protein
MKKTTMYGLLLGFVALFGIATVAPALGENDFSSFTDTSSFNNSVTKNTDNVGVSGA